MTTSNHFKNVTIIGATGNVGSHILEQLLKKRTFHITALSRADSKATFPDGLHVVKVDYEDHAALVNALKGADVLVITLAVTAPPEQQGKIFHAAAEAKVPWVLPNEWGHGTGDEQVGQDVLLGPKMAADRRLCKELGLNRVSVCSSFWYEWSLCMNPVMYGFDMKNHAVTFYGDGNVPQNTSTWPQTGRAAAELLSLPITSSDGSPCVSDFKNGFVYVTSFHTNQKEMFESIKRVTKTTDKDWTITYEDPKERYEAGKKELYGGSRLGFGKLLYARMFWDDEPSNFLKHHKISNDVLGLPKEDMDEATARAIAHAAKTGGWST